MQGTIIFITMNIFHQLYFSNQITEEIEELQSQIQVVHNANEERKKLIHLLDQRDAELRSQHLELQSKLTELQTKKSQVDHLVAALNRNDHVEDNGKICSIFNFTYWCQIIALSSNILKFIIFLFLIL